MKQFLSILLFLTTGISQAQITVDTSLNAQALVERFMGEGVNVFNVRVRGNNLCLGAFEMKNTYFPMESGIVLSTGQVSAITSGKNNYPNHSTAMRENAGSDNDLMRMVSTRIYNITVIEFDFIPLHDSVYFDYVFASEEYPEYVGSRFNDVFCLMLSGPQFPKSINLARLGNPPVPVTVNNINSKKNKSLFLSNHGKLPDGYKYQVEFDGFTTLLTASSPVRAGKKHHLKIAIGNTNDMSYDSGVFLRAGSFGSRGEAGGKNRYVLPFDFNSHDVRQEYISLFDTLALLLKANPAWKISILGHTDSIGSKEYNDTLSYERAREAARQLTDRGVSPKQLFIKGYGYTKPIAPNSSDNGRQKNRRVEMVINRKDS